jgi:hypothetical protein
MQALWAREKVGVWDPRPTIGPRGEKWLSWIPKAAVLDSVRPTIGRRGEKWLSWIPGFPDFDDRSAPRKMADLDSGPRRDRRIGRRREKWLSWTPLVWRKVDVSDPLGDLDDQKVTCARRPALPAWAFVRPTIGRRGEKWLSLRQEKLEKGGSASKHRNLSSRPCGLTNPARQSLAGSRKRVLRGEG